MSWVLLTATIAISFAQQASFAQQPQPPANVVAMRVVQREVAAGHSFVGHVIPSRRSVVGSAVDGRVVELFVNDGNRVVTVQEGDPPRLVGQPIVQLLTEAISIELAAARAAEELRRHELAESEAGSRVEEIAQAMAKLEGAKALREFSQGRYLRIKSLYETGSAAAKEQFEDAMAIAENANQNYAGAQAAYEMARKGPREEQVAQARARLAMAIEDVRRLEDQHRKFTIRAPFEGYVVSKLTEVGAWLSRGDPVAEIIALDPIEIDVSLPEIYIAHVSVGEAVQVSVEALPGQAFTGEVARIVPQADLRARSFPVKIRMNNPKTDDGHLLKAGMLARVTMAVGARQQALMVPKDALVLGGPSPAVMVVDTDPRANLTVARLVPVQLGVADESLIQVIGDVRVDQQVIVVGNERVRPGQPIAVQSTPSQPMPSQLTPSQSTPDNRNRN